MWLWCVQQRWGCGIFGSVAVGVWVFSSSLVPPLPYLSHLSFVLHANECCGKVGFVEKEEEEEEEEKKKKK